MTQICPICEKPVVVDDHPHAKVYHMACLKERMMLSQRIEKALVKFFTDHQDQDSVNETVAEHVLDRDENGSLQFPDGVTEPTVEGYCMKVDLRNSVVTICDAEDGEVVGSYGFSLEISVD